MFPVMKIAQEKQYKELPIDKDRFLSYIAYAAYIRASNDLTFFKLELKR